MTQASRIEQQVMYARFVYDKHDHYYVGMEGDLEVSSLSIEDDGIFAPRDVSAIFDQIEMLFDLARKLSEADKERD